MSQGGKVGASQLTFVIGLVAVAIGCACGWPGLVGAGVPVVVTGCVLFLYSIIWG